MPDSEQKHLYTYQIDENGGWACEGNPVKDHELFSILSRSLFEKEGKYFIRCEGEVHPVVVADAPLFVRHVHIEADSEGHPSKVQIELRDGRREELAADTLTVREGHALYCIATRNRLRARFSRAAYYELTRYLQEETERERFYFKICGKRYFIRTEC